MIELDSNVFIEKWFLHIDKYVNSYKEYIIYYIDGSKRQAVFSKESTEEQIKPQLLSIINKDLKEKGWIKENRLTQHQMLQQQIELEKNCIEKESTCNFTIESMTSSDIIGLTLPIDNEESNYNPADDPYYKQEWLYV